MKRIYALFVAVSVVCSLYADLYLALVPAMLLGRVVGGAAQALEYLGGTESYSLAMWTGSYFVGTMPGAVLQATSERPSPSRS